MYKLTIKFLVECCFFYEEAWFRPRIQLMVILYVCLLRNPLPSIHLYLSASVLSSYLSLKHRGPIHPLYLRELDRWIVRYYLSDLSAYLSIISLPIYPFAYQTFWKRKKINWQDQKRNCNKAGAFFHERNMVVWATGILMGRYNLFHYIHL